MLPILRRESIKLSIQMTFRRGIKQELEMFRMLMQGDTNESR
jgi:hypothetical protein